MFGLAIGVATVASASAATYQSMAPTGQWFGKNFCGGNTALKQIALTFDDGPNDPHTLHLLDVLARHNVRATFFMIGRYVRQRPDLAAEVAKRGHIVGNHTFTHPLLTFQSMPRIREEITHCRAALTDVVGEHSNLFRPPWGGRRPGVFSLVRQLGLEPVMWNVTGYDWNPPSADYIDQKVSRRIRGGAIVLLHDGGHAAFGADRSKTVRVVDRIVTRYKVAGYDFVTIPEMAKRS
jgi:peptidoglycan/xylan/chitin deacetylase (PgdA/CDA1 family)